MYHLQDLLVTGGWFHVLIFNSYQEDEYIWQNHTDVKRGFHNHSQYQCHLDVYHHLHILYYIYIHTYIHLLSFTDFTVPLNSPFK